MMNLKRHTRWALPVVLVALTALVYWPGLGGGFILDDYSNIVFNQRVHAESLTWAALQSAAQAYEPGIYGRPLATVTFAINYALGGDSPWGYKLAGLLVHLANTLLVFWLLRRVLALPAAGRRWSPAAAFTVALLWAVHPLQVSSVLYVVQRMETLALTFVVLSLISYIHGRVAQIRGRRGWPWLAGSALLAGIGLLSKETAALFPVYALALELTVLGFESHKLRTRHVLQAGYASGFGAAALVFVIYVAPPYLAPDAFAGRDFNLEQRLLSQLRVLPMHIGQMVLPLPAQIGFYYDDFVKSTGWLSPTTTLAGGVFLLALLVAAWGVRRRMPLAALGILWFFSAHLLTSNVFTLELAFEHRNYFALLGILLALADLVERLPMRDGPRLKQFAIGIGVVAFGFLCLLRSATWGDPVHLAVELVAKNPKSSRASHDLATIYVGMSDSNPESPFYAMGERELERGSRLPDASPLHEQALILMAATTGQPVKAEWWDRLIHKLETRPVGPQEMLAATSLVKQRYRGIKLDDARLAEALQTLLRRKPTAHLHVQFANFALTHLGDEALADKHFSAAVQLASTTDPGYPARLAQALLSDGRVRQATNVLEQMERLGLSASSEAGE